jgi:hypothetical protein
MSTIVKFNLISKGGRKSVLRHMLRQSSVTIEIAQIINLKNFNYIAKKGIVKTY